MASLGHVRDNELIDALEGRDPVSLRGSLWRVVREGYEPCQCASAGGRWDDRTFDVLYTAAEMDGAIAEMHFHLSRGLPVLPSKVHYRIFELTADLSRLLNLAMLDDLAEMGVDVRTYGQLSHADLKREYPRTQDIAETAHFLEYEGIIVPSARWDCTNVIVFCDQVPAGAVEVTHDHGRVDWPSWIRENKKGE
jgi:RES domain-containing protein